MNGAWQEQPRTRLAGEYWDHIQLTAGERVLLEIEPSTAWEKFYLTGALLLGSYVFIAVWGVLAGPLALLVLFIAGSIRIWAIEQTRWAITNQRILMRYGVFDKKAIVIPLDKIVGVSMDRPLFSQFWQRASVRIDTAGGPGQEMVIDRQSDPDTIVSTISKAKLESS